MNKKVLMVIALLLAVVSIVVFVVLRQSSSNSVEPTAEPEETMIELPDDQKPYVTLTPRSDGHWLKLSISGLSRVPQAATLDYMITYDVPGGEPQGSSGRGVKLNGLTVLERDILLGSESSGKYRYDEGVERGMLTVRFRDANKKLIGGVTTGFRLQSNTSDLGTFDNVFSYKMNSTPKKGYFVVMDTAGLPEGVPGTIESGPFGVFKSEAESQFPATITMPGARILKYESGKWQEASSGKAQTTGVFVGVR